MYIHIEQQAAYKICVYRYMVRCARAREFAVFVVYNIMYLYYIHGSVRVTHTRTHTQCYVLVPYRHVAEILFRQLSFIIIRHGTTSISCACTTRMYYYIRIPNNIYIHYIHDTCSTLTHVCAYNIYSDSQTQYNIRINAGRKRRNVRLKSSSVFVHSHAYYYCGYNDVCTAGLHSLRALIPKCSNIVLGLKKK